MKILALARRIIRQFKRDRRSLALLVIAPILVITLVWLVLDGDSYEPKIAVGDFPDQFTQALNELDIDVLKMNEIEIDDAFKNGEIDAYVYVEANQPKLLLEGSDPLTNSAVLANIQSIFNNSDVQIEIDYFYGNKNLNIFDQVGSTLIGFFVFFFVFIIGGISFLRERTQGTLEKLLSTPIKRYEIVFGYLLGFGIFIVIQSIITILYSVYVLDVYMVGSILELLFVTLILSMTALTLAILLSTYAKNEFQIMQFIPIVIIPQAFFTGIFNLDSMATWIQALSKVMPLTYGADAIQQIMIKGNSLLDIWDNLVILLLFAILFIVLNIMALKKHRSL